MPRAVAVLLDRGGAEPYSDTNAPASLEMTLGSTPANPTATEAVLWTPDGKSLSMKASDGTVTQIGPSSGGSSAIAGTLTNNTVATTETVIASFLLPANYLAAGTLLNIRHLGQVSSTATLTYRVRVGTLGTIADPLAIAFGVTAAGAALAHASGDVLVACLTAGTTGTVTAGGTFQLQGGVVGPFAGAFAAATVNTTVANRVTVTLVQSAAQTYTSRVGVLTKVA